MSTAILACATRVPESFLNLEIWPQFRALSKELDAYFSEATRRVLKIVLDADDSEASVRDEAQQLGAGGGGS